MSPRALCCVGAQLSRASCIGLFEQKVNPLWPRPQHTLHGRPVPQQRPSPPVPRALPKPPGNLGLPTRDQKEVLIVPHANEAPTTGAGAPQQPPDLRWPHPHGGLLELDPAFDSSREAVVAIGDASRTHPSLDRDPVWGLQVLAEDPPQVTIAHSATATVASLPTRISLLLLYPHTPPSLVPYTPLSTYSMTIIEKRSVGLSLMLATLLKTKENLTRQFLRRIVARTVGLSQSATVIATVVATVRRARALPSRSRYSQKPRAQPSGLPAGWTRLPRPSSPSQPH